MSLSTAFCSWVALGTGQQAFILAGTDAHDWANMNALVDPPQTGCSYPHLQTNYYTPIIQSQHKQRGPRAGLSTD